MILDEVKDILLAEAEAVRNIPVGNQFEKALELIYEQVHIKKGKLITSGMGKAGQIAVNISTTFSSTGTPAVFLHPAEAQHGDLGVIQDNDVMLLISNSGKTREIVELVILARRLRPEIRFIVITGNPDSVLASEANVFIPTGSPREVCALGLTPTTSTTIMTVLGDVLVVLMMKKIGFTNQDYSLRHHGGYLGDKSRQAATLDKNKKI